MKRPSCIPAKDLADLDTLTKRRIRWLLAQSWMRLKAGRKMEQERGIIYPEVGMTGRDVERLTLRLADLEDVEQKKVAAVAPKPKKVVGSLEGVL